MSETRKDAYERVMERVNAHQVAATPPTPDRAAVREALVRVLQSASLKSVDNLDDALGTRHTSTFSATADALLGPAPLPADVQAADSIDVLARHATKRIKHIGREYTSFEICVAGRHDTLRSALAHLQRTEG